MKTVVLDPGHGSWDPGAIAVDGVPEKDFNLSLGLALRDILTSEYECEVLMTRETDTALTDGSSLGDELNACAEVANRANADLLLSLHHDNAGNPSARGGSLYVWTDKGMWLPALGNHRAPRSYAAARKVAPHVQECLARYGIPWKGIMTADFQVLRDAHLPALLLEAFYGSNEEDVKGARSPRFIPDLARALAQGVAAALDLTPRPSWDPPREVHRLKQRGVINTEHDPSAPVTWGQFATVINRVLDRMGRD